MPKKAISAGAVHGVPADLRKVLISDPAARAKWEDITPLARNEWICWVISVKKPETRRQHIERVRTELKEGIAGLVAGRAVLTAEISPYFSKLCVLAKYLEEGSNRIRRLSDFARHPHRKVIWKAPKTNSRETGLTECGGQPPSGTKSHIPVRRLVPIRLAPLGTTACRSWVAAGYPVQEASGRLPSRAYVGGPRY